MTTGTAYASPHPGLLGVDDACVRLGVSRSTLYRMISDGEIARVKHNGRNWIADHEIEDYFERVTREAAKERARRAAAKKRKAKGESSQ